MKPLNPADVRQDGTEYLVWGQTAGEAGADDPSYNRSPEWCIAYYNNGLGDWAEEGYTWRVKPTCGLAIWAKPIRFYELPKEL